MLISATFPSTTIIWSESIINDIQLAFQLVEEYNICECLCCVANINLPRKGQTKALYFTICIRRTKSTLKNSCYPEVM